jgi:hypothetical protein
MIKITTRSIRISGLFLLVASQFFTGQYALAGTIVKVQSKNELTTMITDGKKARMDMSASEYVVIDYKNRKLSMVNPQEKQVMEMSMDTLAGKNSSSGAPKVRDSLSRRGAGPAIAGYETHKYSYSVNGKSCGDIYASIDAYHAKGMKELLKAMRTMVDQQRSMLGGLAGMMDDCTLADMQMVDRIENIGIPMRTVKNGRVESEVKSIQTDVSIPADTFAIPASYKKVSVEQQMQQARQAMPPAMQQGVPPDMQDMMRQMQQSGQMTPEMMEQMRRSQEIMQQYQQPRY